MRLAAIAVALLSVGSDRTAALGTSMVSCSGTCIPSGPGITQRTPT
jgi:hypothetical protein